MAQNKGVRAALNRTTHIFPFVPVVTDMLCISGFA